MYKDHKIAVDKTRPVATATSSNTTGLSNAVSDFLEACANSIKDPFEAISTEDMLYKTKKHNEFVTEMREDWKAKMRKKLNCKACKIREIRCGGCKADLEAQKPTEQPAVEAGKVMECQADLKADKPKIQPTKTVELCQPAQHQVIEVFQSDMGVRENVDLAPGCRRVQAKISANQDKGDAPASQVPGFGGVPDK